MGKLQQKKLEHLKPESKEVRLSDGDGLFFRIRPTGGKSWIYYFRLPKSRALQQITLGSFEDVSLKQARDMLPDLRKLIKQGLDPRQVKAAQINENDLM